MASEMGRTEEKSADNLDLETPDTEQHYNGIGRLRFALWFLSIMVASITAAPLLVMLTDDSISYSISPAGATRIVSLIGGIALWILATKRLQNLGYSWLWVLSLLVPLFNLLVLVECFCYPAGYRETKTLDKAGRVSVCILFAAFALLLLFAVLLPSSTLTTSNQGYLWFLFPKR